MQLEIKVALNFIISYLYNKLPRRRVNIFGEELERQLKNKYQGHWYPEKPYKGSGFRCIHVGEKVDPVVGRAAEESGLDVQDVRNNLPQDLSIWIDPFEVSYQIGEKGPVKVLYVDENGSELDKEIRSSFNPEARVFLPISEPVPVSSDSSSPSPCFGQPLSPSYTPRSTQSLTFTTASFAATKFGSTRMKSSGGRGISANYSSSQLGQSSAIGTLLPHNAPSVQSGYLPQQEASALSPDAEEFVFPRPPLGPLHYSKALKVLEVYGSLNDLSDLNQPSLNLSLNNMQLSNQQTQPVLAN